MTIGDRDELAFERDKAADSGELLALRLYISGKLISDESVYAPTYRFGIDRLAERLRTGFYGLTPLAHLTPVEFFSTLRDSTNSNSAHYHDHLLSLDETIDRYTILIRQLGDQTEIIWSCWDEHNCNANHEVNVIYSTSIATATLLETLSKVIASLQVANPG